MKRREFLQGLSALLATTAIVPVSMTTSFTPAIATAIVRDGAIMAINIDSGGSGYTIPPTVTFMADNTVRFW